VFLGQNQVSLADLGSKVKDALENKTSKEIYVRADARAKYGTVTDAIDNVRTAGVDEVGLLTEQRQTLTKPPAAAGGQ
jgi:biopolymer transport protein ExbD/biopolymer transport protein TolR